MRVLVVGGAGYIGSVTVRLLLEEGHQPVVLDSLVAGHRAAVPAGVPLEVVDTHDLPGLARAFADHRPDAVVYYGGFIQAGASMLDPGSFFANNVTGIINLANTMLEHNVRRLVFSSSAAVYGEPESTPIRETDRLAPVNPYGESKLVSEQMLRWYGSQRGLRCVSLRYFNAAGAVPDAGEDHRPETHLIPAAIQVALGKLDHLDLYGTDYPTPDGTCVRDYVHVRDLAEAHLLALKRCETASGVYNLGNGSGFSNREVIETVRAVTGHPVPVREAPRRAGDPPVLVASSDLARRELGWTPRYPALREIVESAWAWHREHPAGYA